jgi:dipeptidyl aminopeptidase/acylaminoacyl peptidase
VVVSVSSLDPGAPPMINGRPANLFVVGPGGSARLLAGAPQDHTLQVCPAFSPDGSMLAYGETGPGLTDAKTLIVSGFSSAGELEEPTERIRMPAAESFVVSCPVWAPDGRRLAAIAPRGVMIVDRVGTTHLVDVDARDLEEWGNELKWSPDGSQLALLVPSGGAHPPVETVWLVPADGGAAHRLARFEPDTSDIAWTADGRSLLAVGATGICCPEDPPLVKVVDVATGDTHDVPLPLLRPTRDPLQVIGSRDDRFLVWSGWDVPLAWFDLRGNVTPVHLEDPMGSIPTLSPDGRQLLYVTYDPALGLGQTLIAVPLDGGPTTKYSPSTDAFGDNWATYTWQPLPPSLPNP